MPEAPTSTTSGTRDTDLIHIRGGMVPSGGNSMLRSRGGGGKDHATVPGRRGKEGTHNEIEVNISHIRHYSKFETMYGIYSNL